MTKELMQQALDALESLFSGKQDDDRAVKCSNAILALRGAIAQPVKPTRMLQDDSRDLSKCLSNKLNALQHVKAQPVQPSAVCDSQTSEYDAQAILTRTDATQTAQSEQPET